MNAAPRPDPLPASPHATLRACLLDVVRHLEADGQTEAADRLRLALETWWRDQRVWTDEVMRQLGVHHDINNALVGVRGNVQLLLMGPATQAPGVKDRLGVVLRESDRIREAALRINALKMALTTVAHEGESTPSSRAA